MPFWAFYRAGSYDGSLLHIWVSLLKLLLFIRDVSRVRHCVLGRTHSSFGRREY